MLGWVAVGADEIVRVKGRFELLGFELQRVHCISNLEGTNLKNFFILIPPTNSIPPGVDQIMKFVLLNFFR